MRQRSRITINRATGQVTPLGTETISDTADFAQRAAELKATAQADMPNGRVLFFTVTCDGCGHTARVSHKNPALPRGWTAQETGDFCKRCSAGTN